MGGVRGWRYVALVTLALALGACTEVRLLSLGSQCDLASECLDPLTCRLGRCRRACDLDRDCTPPTHCVLEPGSEFGACTLPDEARCALDSECPDGLICRLTLCTNECAENRDCPRGARCDTDVEAPYCEHAEPKGCVYASDCEEPLVCSDEGRCVFECLLSSDCAANAQCADRRCVPLDAGPPPPRIDAGPLGCTADAQCDNGVFCDGAERCEPGSAEADADGCAPANGPPCTAPATCDESLRGCVTACDGDGDGADARSCGGDDCDDTDPTRAPGLPDDCNFRDDDCDDALDEDVDLSSDSAHCGLCGNACNYANARGQCVDSFCEMRECFSGFVNADGDEANGCEAGCGAVEICNGGDDDCDERVDEDPEASASCAAANSVATCVSGACSLACDAGFDDCNNDTRDGCEADLSRPETCRSCAVSCGAGLSCEAAGCESSPIVDLYAGGAVTCIRRANGALACWGENSSGALGDGTRSPSNTPQTVPGLSGITQVGVGGEAGTSSPLAAHMCAVDGADVVRCWGANEESQALQSTGSRVLSPTPVAAIAGAQVEAGWEFTCVRTPSGEVLCGGEGERGQLGDGNDASSTTPVTVSGLTGTQSIGLGALHACAVMGDATVMCWGFNEFGATGDGTSGLSNRERPSPVVAIGVSDVSAIVAGYQHTCALHTDRSVSCWGFNNRGQLGDGTTVTLRTSPVTPLGLGAVDQLVAGDYFTCARLGDGTVSCWGSNSEGQLGDGAGGASSAERETPAPVTGLAGVTRIAAGANHACALTSAGEVWCWGRNAGGQVGNGTFDAEVLEPVRVLGLP